MRQQAALVVILQCPTAYDRRRVIGMLKTLLEPGLLNACAACGYRPDWGRFSAIGPMSFAWNDGSFLAGQDLQVLAQVARCAALLGLALVGAVVFVRSDNAFRWSIMLFSTYTVSITGRMGLTGLRCAAEGFLCLQARRGLRCLRDRLGSDRSGRRKPAALCA